MREKVKAIYFHKLIPGQPIYLMENGDIMIPYPDGRTNAMLWLTEKEATDSLTKNTPENLNTVCAQFAEIRRMIGLEKGKRKIITFKKDHSQES